MLVRATPLALVAVAALPAGAFAARLVEPVSVSETLTVPADTGRSLTLQCPKYAVALNGAATDGGARASIPGGNAQRWTFRFAAAPAERRAGAVLRCVRLRLPDDVRGVGLVVGTVTEPLLGIPAASSRRLELRCLSGYVPTGWGLEQEGDELAIAAAVPSARGWTFEVQNTGPEALDATLHIRCLEQDQRAASGQRHTFETRVATFTDRVTESDSARNTCRSSEFSVATGVSLDPAAGVLLDGSHPTGSRGGVWSFTGGGTQADSTLVCLARDSRFRG